MPRRSRKRKLAQVSTFQPLPIIEVTTPKESKRLRCIGVSFLKFWISKNLFQSFPNSNEGELTEKYKSEIFNIHEKLKFYSNGGRSSSNTYIGNYLIKFGVEATSMFLNLLIPFKQENVQKSSDTPSSKIDSYFYGRCFQNIEERIGYTFNDRSLLLQAFTHESHKLVKITGSYERLEFLGDAVLEYLIVRRLFYHPFIFDCSNITYFRGYFASNSFLAQWIFMNGLNYYIIFDYKIGIDQKCFADIFESLVGAVFLDSGMNLEVVWNVIYKLMWGTI